MRPPLLSRLPGGRPTEYGQVARKLGEMKIVDPKFAEEKLVKMAKLRYLLVHQYADIDPEQLQSIIQHNLGDIV